MRRKVISSGVGLNMAGGGGQMLGLTSDDNFFIAVHL